MGKDEELPEEASRMMMLAARNTPARINIVRKGRLLALGWGLLGEGLFLPPVCFVDLLTGFLSPENILHEIQIEM